MFQIEVSHLYSPATNKFTLILHVPMVANSNHLNEFLPLPIHFDFAANISITPDVELTFSQLDIPNLFQQFPALTYTLVFTSETPSFTRGGK